MRHLYHREGKTDLGSMRAAALKSSTEDNYRKGENVVLHFHSSSEDCMEHQHEQYPARKKEAKA